MPLIVPSTKSLSLRDSLWPSFFVLLALHHQHLQQESDQTSPSPSLVSMFIYPLSQKHAWLASVAAPGYVPVRVIPLTCKTPLARGPPDSSQLFDNASLPYHRVTSGGQNNKASSAWSSDSVSGLMFRPNKGAKNEMRRHL